MTICVLATGYPRWKNDFDTNYIHYLAKELVKMGMEVHIVAPHAPGLKKEEIMDGVVIHRFQYIFPERFQSLAYAPGIPENIKKFKNKLQVPFFVLSLLLKTLSVRKKVKCDILNAHWLVPSGILGLLFKRFWRQPVITKIYGADISMIRSKLSFLKNLAASVISKSDLIIANSTYTKYVTEESLPIETGKIMTIHDGVDVDRYYPDFKINDGAFLRRFQSKRIILSCGRLVERKGFRYVIESLPGIKKHIPNIVYVLIGDGPQREDLSRLAAERGVADQVLFFRKVSDAELSQYYAVADVFVLPAIVDSSGDTEGLGLVLLEAMASGKPVIGSNVGGIPDIIAADSDYGFLVEPGNISELKEKLILILKNPGLRRKMGENARKKAIEDFSWRVIAKRYYQILNQIVTVN